VSADRRSLEERLRQAEERIAALNRIGIALSAERDLEKLLETILIVMIVIFLLIPLSIGTAAVFLLGFIWAVRSGQYEDTCTPALRPLMEDNHTEKKEKANE